MLTATTNTTATRRAAWHQRPAWRWLVTFAGFPLGSVLARAVAGPIDTTTAALVGGAINGAAIGAVQAWVLRPTGVDWRKWVAATSIGLAVGLAIGVNAVDFRTSIGALVLQGLICGLAVGAAQAAVLAKRLGALAAVWPLYLGGLWAAGWAITTVVGVDVESRYTVFGSSGAITVTLATSILPLALSRKQVAS